MVAYLIKFNALCFYNMVNVLFISVLHIDVNFSLILFKKMVVKLIIVCTFAPRKRGR